MHKCSKPVKSREFRKLEDLNVIDNFLFQQMISDEEDGEEFVRILLRTFTGKHIRNVKIVPQKSVAGIDVDRHGIRMDAYIQAVPDDLDPEAVDAEIVSAGSGYNQLPNVFIFIILPYDPFGRNRTVYTIRNFCAEDFTIPYHDGATKVFLYTKGTVGNTSQKLKDMLKYIQESTDNNVTNQDIASVQNLVNKIKHKKEVGINYMKSWEYEKMITDRAQKAGFEDGFEEGSDKMGALILLLSEAGRQDDIIKIAADKEYRAKLFQEFSLE